MITIGNVKITAVREQVLSMGVVIAMDLDDHVERLWFGTGQSEKGQSLDLLLVEVRAVDGGKFLMGRVRFKVDEKLHFSADHKEILQIAICPEQLAADNGERWRLLVQGVIQGSKRFGVSEIHEHEVNGDQERMIEVMQREGPKVGIEVGGKFVSSTDVKGCAHPERN